MTTALAIIPGVTGGWELLLILNPEQRLFGSDQDPPDGSGYTAVMERFQFDQAMV